MSASTKLHHLGPPMKVFAAGRHGLPNNFVYFRGLGDMISSPLVFAPIRAFGCGPLQGQQASGDFVIHVCALLS